MHAHWISTASHAAAHTLVAAGIDLVLRHVEVALNSVEGQVGHAVVLLRQRDLREHVNFGCAPKQAALSWPQHAQQPCSS